ncbi:MAG: hypothetical protein EPO00_01590 [Chloroflexota bacterium]|nr:MAG: hypothetical protein EPO00_01590 [Chloroflexota bacterium]
MSGGRGPRWPGDPSRGDTTFGPLVGLPDEVFFFVKDRQRRRDAEAHRLAGLAGGARSSGVTAPGPAWDARIARRIRRLEAHARRRLGSSDVHE